MGLFLLPSCRMALLHLATTLLLLAGVLCQPHKRQADNDTEECCEQKMVGDDRYFNIGYDHNGMTWDLNCLSPCIFEKEDQPGSKYCFAAGDMKVECEDDMEYTPTGGPRPTEGPGGNEATEGPGGPTEDGPDGGDGVTTDGGPAGGVTGDGGSSNNGNALLFPLKTSPVSAYPKFTEVFGVAVFGHSSISDAKFQHVASVLAEWLDNDEDGCADIPLVVSKMTTTSPKPFTWAEKDNGELTSAQVDAFISAGFTPSSVTYNSELLPSCAGVAATENCADATLEEVLHMVTDKGYMPAFPSTFSTEVNSNSLLTAAMDAARGGKFTSIPASYPTSAWFTYNDATCDYRCMGTEYVYWGISAYVGSLAGRKNSIANEWKFSTKAELLAGDVKLSAILQDTSSYRAPSVAPDGKYRAPTTCASGAASGATVA